MSIPGPRVPFFPQVSEILVEIPNISVYYPYRFEIYFMFVFTYFPDQSLRILNVFEPLIRNPASIKTRVQASGFTLVRY